MAGAMLADMTRPAVAAVVEAPPALAVARPAAPRVVDPASASSGSAIGWLDWTVLVLPGVIWGASFLFMAEGLRAVDPMGVTFTRLAIGFVTLGLLPAARRPIVRGDWLPIAGIGLIWLAIPFSMFPYAEQHVSSALTGMLNGATPLFA